MHYDAITLPIPIFGAWYGGLRHPICEMLEAARLIGLGEGLAGRGVFSRFDVLDQSGEVVFILGLHEGHNPHCSPVPSG